MTSQQADALKLANHRRLGHARLREELAVMRRRDAMHRIADLIEAEDDQVMAMPLMRLLSSCRGVAVTKVNLMLRHAGVISADRRVRELSDRQRGLLVIVLRNPAMLWPSTREAA